MTSKELERMCEMLKIRTSADIDIRTRDLRKAGFLPVGGRGPHAPHLDETHVACFVLSLASETASSAAQAVQDYSLLTSSDSRTMLVEVLGNAIAADAEDIRVVRLCRGRPVAEIIRNRNGATVRHRYGSPSDLSNNLFESDNFGASTCLTWVEIGRGFLRQLRIEMNLTEADKEAVLIHP